jgi:hypothetical protein
MPQVLWAMQLVASAPVRTQPACGPFYSYYARDKAAIGIHILPTKRALDSFVSLEQDAACGRAGTCVLWSQYHMSMHAWASPAQDPGCSGGITRTLNTFLARMFSKQPKQTLWLHGTKAMATGISSRQMWHSSRVDASSTTCRVLAMLADSATAARPCPHTLAVNALVIMACHACTLQRRACDC